MRTYLKVTFNSDGAKPSRVRDALAGLGFQPMHGAHDFVYDWPDSSDVEGVLSFGDQIHAELQGLGCLFEMETV